MMGSMMSGISGLRNHQTAMDVVGNNIANVNTTGFKASRVLFSQVFSNTMANATAPNSETGTGGTNPMQVGMGSTLASIDMLYTEGNIERTDNPLDVSIDGDGLFIVKENNSSAFTFTRAGAFGVDKNGNLKNASGALVCGWMKRTQSEDSLEEDGFASTMDVEPINLYRDIYNGNKQIIQPEPTTAVVLSGNLNSNTETNETIGIPMTLYDNYGNEIQATMTLKKLENVTKSNSVIANTVSTLPLVDENGDTVMMPDGVTPKTIGDLDLTDPKGVYVRETTTKTGDPAYQVVASRKSTGAKKLITGKGDYKQNEWTYDITVNGKPIVGADDNPITGRIVFSNEDEEYGKLQQVFLGDNEVTDFKVDVVAQYDANPDNKSPLYFDFSSITQYAAKDSVYVYDSNGHTTGTLTEYSIGGDGIITGIYSNGKQQALGLIALASFENYEGLKSVGDSSYTATANSGEFRAKVPGSSAGSLTANTLEMSNVDLSTEFTNMIIYQRGFQANSRGITTADEMLQELVNLKR